MKKTSKILAIITIMVVVVSLVLPIKVNAAEGEITLNLDMKRDETDPNTINITATDTQYNIVALKYVHKDIQLADIKYFEENHDDIYTFPITPSTNISESFKLDGYGVYTAYARNSVGAAYLDRITIHDPAQVPELTLTQNEQNPLEFTIQAISGNSIISVIKIAKVEDINEDIDFNTEGTNLEFTPSNDVNLVYEVSEEGLYEIYVKDENGASKTKQIYLSKNSSPITLEINDLGNREVNLKITDSICNITTIKYAKSSEISNIDDFETKGEEISFQEGKTVDINYTLPEDGTYVFFIKDEAGYRKMDYKRVTESGEAVMTIEIVQDEENPGNVTIIGKSTLSNIVEMKVAIGENIDSDYFKNGGGENLEITPGKEVTANYTVDENCVLNVYIKDEDGYSHLSKRTIIVSNEPIPNQPPKIILKQNETNPKQIDVQVDDMENYIDTIKWAKGSHDVDYFKNNGTQIGQGELGKRINTEFTIDSTGIYTVYAEDEEGAGSVKEINILSIDEAVEPDVTLPVISNVTDNGIYKEAVTPNASDENLASVTLTKNGTVVNNYQNGDTISEEGNYVLTAKDESENETTVKFMIDLTAPELKTSQENIDNKNVEVLLNLTDNLSGVDILKIANGNQNENYFENGGQQINIVKDGLTASGKIKVTKNGIYTAYMKDVAGNSKVQTFEITTIDEEEPEPEPEPTQDTTPPTINLEKEVLQDSKSVNLTINVVDTESQIQKVKMANGKRDITYFENNGTELNMEKGDKTATSAVNITENGTYTIYSEDEAGNKAIKEITITEIKEEEPEPEPTPDTTSPTITGVENGRTYKNSVTPHASDENLAEVTLTRNGTVVENYTNGAQIKENGDYVLTAVDEAGNKTQVSFTIKIEKPEENTTNNTNTNIGNNTNTNTNTNNNTNTNTNTNTNNNNTNTNTGANTNTDNENNTNTNVNTNNNTNTNNSVNNNQNNNVNIPTTNNNSNNNNNNSSGSISTNSHNSSNGISSNITKLPYAGIGNFIIIAIIGLVIVAIFTYIKYRKYRKI